MILFVRLALLQGTPNTGTQLLPLTTAIIGYTIACWCSKGSMFVKDNSDCKHGA